MKIKLKKGQMVLNLDIPDNKEVIEGKLITNYSIMVKDKWFKKTKLLQGRYP